MTDTNPLLQPWTAPYGLPPFDAIRAEHFEPALRQAMVEHLDELRAIAQQPDAPSFDDTVAAFDRSGRLLARIASVFYNLTASETSPALQAVQRAMAAPLAAHDSAVYMDAALFARIDALHARRETLGLTPEQRRLLERIHLDFVRSGAQLAPDGAAPLRAGDGRARRADDALRAERAARRVVVPARAARPRPSSPGCRTSCAPRRARLRPSAASPTAT